MSRQIWTLALALLAALVLALPAHAENDFAKRSSQAFDLVVARPLGVGRIVVGFVCFVPAAVIAEAPWKPQRWKTAIGGAWQLFVGDPFKATFMTPLGVFEEEL